MKKKKKMMMMMVRLALFQIYLCSC
jgi:hypothetical protein